MSEQPPTEYAPPGWFADPTGLQAQRWWDGTQWGQQTRPVRKSWPRRSQVLTVLGSLAALIIVIGGIASTSGNAKRADNASAIAAPTGMATPSRAPTHHATSTKTRPKKVPITVQATTPGASGNHPGTRGDRFRRLRQRPLHLRTATRRATKAPAASPANTGAMPTMGHQGYLAVGKPSPVKTNDGWRWESA